MNQNILEYEIKSISLDSLKLKNIFETKKINNILDNTNNIDKSIDLNILHNNYKLNPLFKKFITLAIKLNFKIFKLENNIYILKSHEELYFQSNKIKKILLKKYAVNILKNVVDDNIKLDIVGKIDNELKKIKKYFIYIEMYNYLLNNVFKDTASLLKLISSNYTPINFPNENINCVISLKSSSECISGKLECLSTNSNVDITFDSNINYNLSSYINYTPSKGKIINISLKSYIAEYSN
jgi:hypothetical protein